jgi:hypothetical protein
VYAFIDRQNLPNLFRTFDFASPDTHCPRRPQTVVPQQGLYLLNNEFVQYVAEKLAARTMSDEHADSEDADEDQTDAELAGAEYFAKRIRRLYRLALAREPSAEELTLAMQFIENEQVEATSGFKITSATVEHEPLDAFSRLAHTLLMTNEFAFVD